MTYDNRSTSGSSGEGPLEDRLWNLSQPPAPPHLRAKILADIPAIRPARPTIWRIGWPWLSAAAALIVVVGALLASRSLIDRNGRIGRPRDTAPGHILEPITSHHEKETRPCDILPPLL
jgi:hypothetical protein